MNKSNAYDINYPIDEREEQRENTKEEIVKLYDKVMLAIDRMDDSK
jgi:hypothetical protein